MKTTRTTTVISFKVSKKVRDLITRVATRYLGKKARDKDTLMELEMDLTAVHCNDVRLDFTRMLKADFAQLGHDIGGIQRHLDRTTGKLTCHFLPRFTYKANYTNTHIKKPKVVNPYLPTPKDHADAILAKKRHARALAGEPKPAEPIPDVETEFGIPVAITKREKRAMENARKDTTRSGCPISGVRDLRRERVEDQGTDGPWHGGHPTFDT